MKTFVGFDELAIHSGGAAINAVGVAAVTELILKVQRLNDGAGRSDAFQAGKAAGRVGSGGWSGRRRVRVVAIRAFNVPGRIDWILHGIMNAAGVKNWVDAKFIELGLDVF